MYLSIRLAEPLSDPEAGDPERQLLLREAHDLHAQNTSCAVIASIFKCRDGGHSHKDAAVTWKLYRPEILRYRSRTVVLDAARKELHVHTLVYGLGVDMNNVCKHFERCDGSAGSLGCFHNTIFTTASRSLVPDEITVPWIRMDFGLR